MPVQPDSRMEASVYDLVELWSNEPWDFHWIENVLLNLTDIAIGQEITFLEKLMYKMRRTHYAVMGLPSQDSDARVMLRSILAEKWFTDVAHSMTVRIGYRISEFAIVRD